MTPTNVLIHLVLYGADVSLMLSVAILMLFKQKEHKDRSRLFFGLFCLLFALAVSANVTHTILMPHKAYNFIPLLPEYTVVSYLIMLLDLLYPIELMRPNWLKWKHVGIMLIPWAFFTITLYCWQGNHIRMLLKPIDILTYINEPNVWLRVILTLLFLPHAVWVLVMPFNWRQSSVNHRQVHVYLLLAFISLLFFMVNNVCKSFLTVNIFRLFVWSQVLYGLYYELSVRIKVPDDQDLVSEKSQGVKELVIQPPVVSPLKSSEDSVADNVFERLKLTMNNPDTWQNPDLQQNDLCRIIGTNRTYLLAAVKKMGYNSFRDMLNAHRIEFIMEELQREPTQNIQVLYYQAGYRSHTTAMRNFIAVAGCTPQKHIDKQIADR